MGKELPNNSRNTEVSEAINRLKEADGGALSHKPAGIAESLSLLNVAESLQLLQLQIIEVSKENRTAMHSAVDKLIASNTKLSESNDRYANAMKWLTGALVIIGVAQVVVSWIK